MADWSVTSQSEAFGMQFNRMAGQIRCAMPGIIQSFDPATQTATVQPALQMQVNLGDGVKHVDLPVITNVPVVLPFAQAAGLLLTLPIRPGDECLLVFSDRAIDSFVQGGGIQPTASSNSADTATPRSHSLSDAICIPGIVSNPQAVPEYSTENIELRDRERKQYISLGPEGIVITDGVGIMSMKEGKFSLITPDVATIESSNMTLGGDGGSKNELEGGLKSRSGTFVDKNDIDSSGHKHTGIQPGNANTGSATA